MCRQQSDFSTFCQDELQPSKEKTNKSLNKIFLMKHRIVQVQVPQIPYSPDFLRRSLMIFIIMGFRTIVFIFIIFSTTFRPICPPAFFMCLLSKFLRRTLMIFIIKGFRTIVFIFIIFSTTFRPICPPAFFWCLLSKFPRWSLMIFIIKGFRTIVFILWLFPQRFARYVLRFSSDVCCLNFWDEAWWFLSLRVFGLLSSFLLLFPQRFRRYVHWPSSGVCRTREPTRNYELRPLLNSRGWGSPVLIYIYIYIYTKRVCQKKIYTRQERKNL